jgi:hypothetical protein
MTTTTTVTPHQVLDRYTVELMADDWARRTGRNIDRVRDEVRTYMDHAYWFAVGWEERDWSGHHSDRTMPRKAGPYYFASYAGQRKLEYMREAVTSLPAIGDVFTEYIDAVREG